MRLILANKEYLFIGSRWIENKNFEVECLPYGIPHVIGCVNDDNQRIEINGSIQSEGYTFLCKQNGDNFELYSQRNG